MNSSIMKEDTKKTPLTAADIFNAVVQRIKDKGAYPEIVDSAEAGRPDYAVPVPTGKYEIRSNLFWGGSDGICLSIWIEFEESGTHKRWGHAGTFKTHERSDSATYAMTKLLADYLIEDSAFRKEHRSAFEFEGYWMRYYDRDGREAAPSLWYRQKYDAVAQAEYMIKFYPKVTITECATDQVEVMVAEPDRKE